MLGLLLLLILALRGASQPAHRSTPQRYPFDAQRRGRRNSILHWRVGVAERIPRDAKLGSALLLGGRAGGILTEESSGVGVQLHGLLDFIFGAIANVDALHHGRIGTEAMRLA